MTEVFALIESGKFRFSMCHFESDSDLDSDTENGAVTRRDRVTRKRNHEESSSSV